jgi:EmrB/QacA subfamily drug resistance transporter
MPETRPRTVLAIVCLGVVLSSLDLFIVNVAMPNLSRSFGNASLASLSWVLNGYTVVFAALLVPAGRLADRFGRRGGFLLGVAIFTAASALCATATSVGMLVAFRVLQAAGGALVTPTSLGLVMAAYPAQRRGSAVRTWAGMGGVAAALGPVLGGLLVSASWRWIFLVNVPVGLFALVVGARVLPRPATEPGPLPDLFGALLLALGIGSVTLALVRGHEWGWGSGSIVGALVAAAVLIAVFVRRSSRHRSPVLELELMRLPGYSITTAVSFLFSVGFGAMLLSTVLWLQDVWGWSALRAGAAVVPGPALVPIFSQVAGRLIPYLKAGRVIALGCAVFACGVAYWAVNADPRPDYLAHVLPGMLLTGTGVGLAMPTIFSTAAASVPPHRFSTGAAVVSMARQLGFAVGVAVLVAVLAASTDPVTAFRRGWFVIAAVMLAGGLSALLLHVRIGPRRLPELPPAEPDLIGEVAL